LRHMHRSRLVISILPRCTYQKSDMPSIYSMQVRRIYYLSLFFHHFCFFASRLLTIFVLYPFSGDYYKRILGKDPANAFAANGLGTILAEKGEIFKAKEVFNRVREVSGDNIADTLVNLGHIYLAQKKHPEALQMYKSYMKRAEDGTTPITSKSRVDDVVEVLLYIAFAYFDWARHTELFNDSNAAPADGRYNEAMNYLQLAIGKHSKREVVLKYNLCMVKLQAANCVLQKLTRNIPRTVEEVQAALDGLQESLVTVEAIIKDKADGKKVLISSTTLQDFLKHCRANISSAESHLKDEKTRAESADEERRIRRLAAEAAQKELQLKVALEREEEAKKQELRDRKADAKMRQVQELQMGWQNEQSAEQEKKTKKTKGGPRAPDVEDEPGLEVDDDDDGQAGGGGGKRGLFDDSDDSDDDDAGATRRPETPPKKSQAQVASQQKDLFGDSDDSDDDDDKALKKNGNVGSSPVAKEDATDKAKVVAEATQGLFGDSSDEDEDDDGGESDEEIARADDTKKRGAEMSAGGAVSEDADQPAKKRRVLEEEDDDDDNDDD
jgi:RNA polymerase-associated protein CTR9